MNETLLDKAFRNLDVAKMIKNQMGTDEYYLNFIGYHLQQAVELGIKHIMEINGFEFPKKHEIEQLILYAKEEDINLHLTEYIDEHAEMFSLWEAKTRYIKNYKLEMNKIEKALVEVENYLGIVMEKEKNIELNEEFSFDDI